MENVFSERLLQARRDRNLSQRAAAALIGIQAASLSSYESGRNSPNLEIASKIAAAYGCSLDWLCGIESATGNDDMLEKMTKAEAFRKFTALCESGIPLEIHTAWFRSNGKEDRIDLCIKGCEWLAKMIDTYQKLLELLKAGEIESEVLSAWKEKKMQELDEPIFVTVCDEELPF